MENNETVNMQAENQTGGAPAAQATEPEKLYTQADIDAAVEKRLARERKGMPPKEEWDAFRKWKDSQQTEQDRQQKLLEERNGFEKRVTELEEMIEEARREKFLLQKGVPVSDVDFYAFKAGKLVSDTVTFERAAEQILQERQEQGERMQASPQPYGFRASFGPPAGTGGKVETLAERIDRELRGG